MRWKYGYRLSSDVITVMLKQLLLGVAAYLTTLSSTPWIYWPLGGIVIVISLAISLNTLRKKTHLWESLKLKLKKKFKKSED